MSISEESSEDSDNDESDSVSDIMSSPNSSLNVNRVGRKEHRRDKESKNALLRKLKKTKRLQQEKDDNRKKKKKEKERKRNKLQLDSDTVPLPSLETGEYEPPSSTSFIPPSTFTPSTSTYLPPTTTPTTTEITPQVMVRPPVPIQVQPKVMPLAEQQHKPKSAESEYAYIVYVPDTNYVAVSRSLKNLLPKNTSVVYKVDETSNLSEAGSVMKSIKSSTGVGAQQRDQFLSELSTIPTSESPPRRPPSSPTSGKTFRSIRSNYFIVNSDLLLKNHEVEEQKRANQLQPPKPSKPMSTASIKTNETVFVYSTKAQFAKLPGYAQQVQSQPTRSEPKIRFNPATETNKTCQPNLPVAGVSQASGMHVKPKEQAQVRFLMRDTQPPDEASEPSDDSDLDDDEIDNLRAKEKLHKLESEIRRQAHKRRDSSTHDEVRRKSSVANLAVLKKSKHIAAENEEADSDKDSDDSGDDRAHRKRAATEVRKNKKRRGLADGRRKGRDARHRRHTGVRLPGNTKRLIKKRHTSRRGQEDRDD